MKKIVAFCLISVIFVLFAPNPLPVFSTSIQNIDFVFNNKIFTYQLEKNIKKSKIFEFEHQINKHNRFGSNEDRKNLLSTMLSIGIDQDIALEYLFPNLNQKIEQIEKNIYINAKDAKLKINTNSEKVFHITKESVGACVDKQELYKILCNKLLTNSQLEIQIPTKTLMPSIFEADFNKFTNLRADFSTDISSSSTDRKHNIKNALKTLNLSTIAPNETFSFNKTIGRRTRENGYREAKIIVNNEFVEGFGGGVCQVSSTLYNAALLSGLEIVEANKHSKQVGYVKYGFDAMVNYGSSDLKFKNNTSEKLTIVTNYSNNNLRIRIYGQSLGNTTYKLSNEIVSVTEPEEIVEFDTNNQHTDKVVYEDEYFYLKKASKGMEIKSFREVYMNGNLLNKELLRHDKFKVQNAVKMYGTKKRTENDALENSV